MMLKVAAFTVTVRVEDVPTFLNAARAAGWSALDSGERITTEDGVAREAIVILRIPTVAPMASEPGLVTG